MAYGILIIEDEAILAKKLKKYLEQYDYEVRVFSDGESGLDAFENFRPDLVLLDFNLPGQLNGLEVLRRIRALDSHVKVILITGHGNERLAVDAMKAGAYDYLGKPVVLSELKLLIDKAVGLDRLEGALSYYHEREASKSGLDSILGRSPPVLRLKEQIAHLLAAERKLADAEAPAVLISGETGTGKELIARALHFDGVRKDKPFVEVNAATIPSHLVESELFGYERGAFTDARERKLGLVESAHGGTLFLDEIGDLEPAVQVKLLKLLEDKTVRRLGSVRDHKVNIRIITATNHALEELVREGKFRADLYYRLRIVNLHAPALRERGQDIIMLAEHFLAFHAQRYGKPGLCFDAAARGAILAYAWPGNIRELRNVIEQAVLLAKTDTIGPAQLAFHAIRTGEAAPAATATNQVQLAGTGSGTLETMELQLIVDTLNNTGWNVTRAAQLLGISRDQLRYRIEKYGLKRQF